MIPSPPSPGSPLPSDDPLPCSSSPSPLPLLPAPPSLLPPSLTSPLSLKPYDSLKAPVPSLKTYADRMQADYVRYRMAKESADTFYSRLAVLQNSFNPFRYCLNPLALKSLMLPGDQYPPSALPPPSLPRALLPHVLEGACRKRSLDDPHLDTDKKHRGAGNKRKVAKKLNFDEEKSSPVSGTLIRVLEEGEKIPPVHKGDFVFDTSFLDGILFTFGIMCFVFIV